jgi:octaprenyl-diphosphate synthase
VSTPRPTISASAGASLARAERFLDLIAPKLHLVEEELRRNFTSEIQTIQDVGKHILEGGGKRLRPALLLLVARMLGYKGSRDVTYGAVVEFIHTATLVHDDIIDEAALRRGRTSINYRWGNHLTVLVGDYLYTHAMKMALDEGDLDVLKLLSRITIRMIEGEILALEFSGRADVTSDEYFDIISRKTAELFGGTCRLPGYLVRASEEQAGKLYDFGYNLGICFQLTDDLLDFTSSSDVLGKPVLSDLREGKLTLPLILTLPRLHEGERRKIERALAERSFDEINPEEVIALVNRFDGVDQTLDIAREYADRARAALSNLPASAEREALETALDFVLNRSY